jgi:hypothetical protein
VRILLGSPRTRKAATRHGIKLDGTSVDVCGQNEMAMNARWIGAIAFFLIPGLALAQTGQRPDKTDQTGNDARSTDRNGNGSGANGSDANGAETPSGSASDANAKAAPPSKN